MGCDIHIYVESKEDGKWKHAQGLVDGEVPYGDQLYHGRNYTLFGFLAGVRESDKQHFNAKGFPEDASKEVKKIWDEVKGDYHTPSYLTLKELQGVNWDDPIVVSGMMEKGRITGLMKEAKKKHPDYGKIYGELLFPYCAWTNDTNSKPFRIEVPRRHEFKDFLEIVEKRLPRYSWEGPENVRIVFWFDN
jgi:hypothetical protein